MRTLSECDAVHDVIRLVVNQFQLDMFLVASHYFAGSVVIDVMRTEDRFDIVRTERIEFLQVIEEFRCDVSEVDLRIYIDDGANRRVKASTFSTFMDNPAA